MEQGLEKGKVEGLGIGIESGIEKGKLEIKHDVHIRQISLKYTLSEDEMNHILSVNNIDKLDAVLDTLVLSDNKEYVLKVL